MTFWLDDPDEVIHKFIGDKETARQVHLVAVFSGAQLFSKLIFQSYTLVRRGSWIQGDCRAGVEAELYDRSRLLKFGTS